MSFIISDTLDYYSKHTKGIAFIPTPTGSGKSFEAAIFAMLKAINSGRTLVFTTPRIKNKNEFVENLFERIDNFFGEDKENRNRVKSKILVLDPNTVSRTNNLSQVKKDILNILKYNDDLKKSFSNLEYYILMKQDKKNPTDSFPEEDFREAERSFRHNLSKIFNERYKKEVVGKDISPYEFMMSSDEWRFISKLYPASLCSAKQIFIMTSSKFLVKNDPIISEKYYFFNNKDFMRNAIIIIDEVDFVKREILDNIFSKNLVKDIAEIFKSIFNALYHEEEMDFKDIDEYKIKINKLSFDCKEIKEKYFKNKWAIKFYKKNKDKEGIIEEAQFIDKIMNYTSAESYYDTNKSYVYIPYCKALETINPDIQSNIIISKNDLNSLADFEFLDLNTIINDISHYINSAFFEFSSIAKVYKERRKHRKKIELSDSDSISSVLKKLNFSKDSSLNFVDYILDIVENKNFNKELSSNSTFLYSVYDRGFSIVNILQEEKFGGDCSLNNYEMKYTPELMLADWTSKALIIGMSATAEHPGISNFNWNYISKKLESYNKEDIKIHEIPEDIMKSLKNDYYNKTRGYSVDINTGIPREIKTIAKSIKVDCKNTCVNVAKDLAILFTGELNPSRAKIDFINQSTNYHFGNIASLESRLKLKKSKKTSISDPVFEYTRLKKIWIFIKNILELYKSNACNKAAISNGIIMTNKGIDLDGNEIFSLSNIKMGTICIYANVFDVSFEEAKKAADNMFVVINSGDLNNENQDKIKFIKDKFKRNEPIFMFTTYGSVSRGNNLKVNIGKNELRQRISNNYLYLINDWTNNGYVDWDSIYIEKPAYIIPKLSDNYYDNNDRSSTSKATINTRLRTFLMIEELLYRKEIDKSQKNILLKEVFNSFQSQNPSSEEYKNLYSTPSVLAEYTTTIYQTIGRISRTNVKKPCSAIFYDYDIVNYVDFDSSVKPSVKEKLNIPIISNEFKRFIEDVKKEKDILYNASKEKSYKSFEEKNRFIYEVLSNILDRGRSDDGWCKDLQILWETIRNIVLKYPVISKEKLEELSFSFNKMPYAIYMNLKLEDLYLNLKRGRGNPTNKPFIYYYAPGLYISNNNNNVYSLNDFKDVLVDKRLDYQPSKLFKYEVSLEDSRLSKLLRNDIVYNHWIKNGFSINWKINKSEKYYGMISPIVFNNIYKGALGEEVVKALFIENGIPISNIEGPKIYEKFDFVINENEKIIYIDVKNFSETSMHKDFANEGLSEKLNKKINSLKPDCVAVINLIDEFGEREFLDKFCGEDNSTKLITCPGIFYINIFNNLKINLDGDKKDIFTKIKEIIYE